MGLISALINLLHLTGPRFMLQVYDRVLSSRSAATLLALAALTVALFGFQGLLDLIRTRIFVRIAAQLDRNLGPDLYRIIVQFPLRGGSPADGLQPLRDLDQARNFLTSAGPAAFFDLPWIPIYVAVCFMFHPWIGFAALGGAALLVAIAGATEFLTKRPLLIAAKFLATRNRLTEAGRRSAEALRAMGMADATARLCEAARKQHMEQQSTAGDWVAGFAATARVARLALQSGVLGLGAYLVLEGAATGGVIIAGSILTARALAPAELATAHWKHFVAARQSWARLNELLRRFPPERQRLALPQPRKSLTAQSVSCIPPGGRRPVVRDVDLVLEAGSAVALVGPSGSGKSSLARLLVGVWPTANGTVRIDGAALDQWAPEALGHHIGYLPQDVELFEGTVAQNIARFLPDTGPKDIVSAAVAAGVHDMILALPEGYDTALGEGGSALSAGQRQRIALARALFRDPFLVVLDEPDSHLDRDGETMVNRAILGVRARGGIAVVVTHRAALLSSVDFVMVMRAGAVHAFGPRRDASVTVAGRPAAAEAQAVLAAARKVPAAGTNSGEAS